MNEDTKTSLKVITFLSVLVLLGGVLGWLGNDAYESFNYERKVDGFYAEGYNFSEVEDYQNNRDKYGDWICVNVRNMDYERALETCKHETGHEIFAEYCESNITKCFEGLE